MVTLGELRHTKWAGSCELWLDPLGDDAVRCDCEIALDATGVNYRWSYEGKAQQGRIALREGGADFSDTWHQPEAMRCADVAGALGLFQVQGQYGPQQDWNWRIGLFSRTPTGELVLQMTNLAPWGEEARAVRMVCKRQL